MLLSIADYIFRTWKINDCQYMEIIFRPIAESSRLIKFGDAKFLDLISSFFELISLSPGPLQQQPSKCYI